MSKRALAKAVKGAATKKPKVSFIPQLVAVSDPQLAVRGNLAFEHCVS